MKPIPHRFTCILVTFSQKLLYLSHKISEKKRLALHLELDHFHHLKEFTEFNINSYSFFYPHHWSGASGPVLS